MASKLPPPAPARLTGDADADANATMQWINGFYQSAVVEHRLLDPNRQFVPDPIDPDSLPDATNSSIANAQATANLAYTNGAAKAQEALDTANVGIAAANTAIAAEATARAAAITAEATARAAADVTLTTAAAAAQTAANLALAHGPVLHGQVTVINAATTGVFTFADQGTAALRAVLIPHSKFGTPPDGAFIVESVAYTNTTATVTVRAAPGASNAVTWDVILFKIF